MSVPNAVDGSSANIAMCHIAVALSKQQMTAYGTFLPVMVLPMNGCFQG